MKKRLIHKVGFFLFYRQYEIEDILLGFLGIFWGLWVANPFMTTFTLDSYVAFNHLVPEWVWGGIVCAIGVFTLMAAICKHEYHFRASTLIVNVLIWSYIGIQFLLSEPSNTGFVMYSMVSLMSVWLYLRLTIFTKMIDFSSKDLRSIRKMKDK